MTFTPGRFILCNVPTPDDGERGYVTSWDTWEECEVAFLEGRMPAGHELHDDETGRIWYPGARYGWEEAQT